VSGAAYTVDASDPRAPSQAVWDALSESERRQVLDSLPSEIPRTSPPEGDEHQLPKERSKLTLREYFRRRGRSVYLGSELPFTTRTSRCSRPISSSCSTWWITRGGTGR
jgi:hypothetical protein